MKKTLLRNIKILKIYELIIFYLALSSRFLTSEVGFMLGRLFHGLTVFILYKRGEGRIKKNDKNNVQMMYFYIPSFEN